MVRFVELAAAQIPTFAGLKFTTLALHEFQTCLELDGRRFDALWGVDEMLLGAAAVGARGAVGSTYNIAAPIANRILEACDNGNLLEARKWQSRLIATIRVLGSYSFHAALKQTISWLGVECGPCRLPLENLTRQNADLLHHELEALGFFEWRRREGDVFHRTDGPSAAANNGSSRHRGEIATGRSLRNSRIETDGES